MVKTAFHNAPPNPAFDPASAPKDELRREFGRRLQAAMVEKGWNQSELGRRAGVSRDNVSNYVRGTNLPGPAIVKRLAEALGVDGAWLLPLGAAGARSVDRDAPALEVKSAGGDLAWLRINQQVKWDVALKIMALLKGEA